MSIPSYDRKRLVDACQAGFPHEYWFEQLVWLLVEEDRPRFIVVEPPEDSAIKYLDVGAQLAEVFDGYWAALGPEAPRAVWRYAPTVPADHNHRLVFISGLLGKSSDAEVTEAALRSQGSTVFLCDDKAEVVRVIQQSPGVEWSLIANLDEWLKPDAPYYGQVLRYRIINGARS